MIERLLVARRALEAGQLDHAERLFRQVADADERNAIAVVGLAEVALGRGDREAAASLADRALEIDPDDAAAARVRTEALGQPSAPPPEPHPAMSEPSPSPAGPSAVPSGPSPSEPSPLPTPSLVDRLRTWLRRLVGRPG